MPHPAKIVTTVGGLDPGPKPGSVVLSITESEAVCDAGAPLVSVTARTDVPVDQLLECDYLAVERYVIQPRSGRSQDKGAQALTLAMAEDVHQRALLALGRPRCQYLGPGNVKPWATDRRLDRYGLLVKGGHHRDAVRHALYLAVRYGLLPRL